MAFNRVRSTWTVLLMVPAWPESGFGGPCGRPLPIRWTGALASDALHRSDRQRL